MYKEFPKIPRANKVYIEVTQKLHGTNASVHVIPVGDWQFGDVFCGVPKEEFLTSCKTHYILPGKRTSYISTANDNFGFAKFVAEQKDAFLVLGPGQHFGEWCGPGINSGEGLTERRFYLFDRRFTDIAHQLPRQVHIVPLIATIRFDEILLDAMRELQYQGSRAVPGFDRPEGVVAKLGGTGLRIKQTFEQEVSAWEKAPNKEHKTPGADYSPYVTNYRLDKILSRESALAEDIRGNFGYIVGLYVADVVDEEFNGADKDTLPAIRIGLAKEVRKFLGKEVAKLLRKRI